MCHSRMSVMQLSRKVTVTLDFSGSGAPGGFQGWGGHGTWDVCAGVCVGEHPGSVPEGDWSRSLTAGRECSSL